MSKTQLEQVFLTGDNLRTVHKYVNQVVNNNAGIEIGREFMGVTSDIMKNVIRSAPPKRNGMSNRQYIAELSKQAVQHASRQVLSQVQKQQRPSVGNSTGGEGFNPNFPQHNGPGPEAMPGSFGMASPANITNTGQDYNLLSSPQDYNQAIPQQQPTMNMTSNMESLEMERNGLSGQFQQQPPQFQQQQQSQDQMRPDFSMPAHMQGLMGQPQQQIMPQQLFPNGQMPQQPTRQFSNGGQQSPFNNGQMPQQQQPFPNNGQMPRQQQPFPNNGQMPRQQQPFPNNGQQIPFNNGQMPQQQQPFPNNGQMMQGPMAQNQQSQHSSQQQFSQQQQMGTQQDLSPQQLYQDHKQQGGQMSPQQFTQFLQTKQVQAETVTNINPDDFNRTLAIYKLGRQKENEVIHPQGQTNGGQAEMGPPENHNLNNVNAELSSQEVAALQGVFSETDFTFL